jgi:hypothetical protein
MLQMLSLPNLLLIDHTGHAALAVVAIGLGAVEPDRVVVGDSDRENIGLQ